MKKTAEEIMIEYFLDETGIMPIHLGKQIVKAMHDFAAQEVAEALQRIDQYLIDQVQWNENTNEQWIANDVRRFISKILQPLTTPPTGNPPQP